jgi:PAS domain S-box-containing protein
MNVSRRPFTIIASFALVFFLITESLDYYFGLEEAKQEAYVNDKLLLDSLTSAQTKNIQILASVLSSDERVKQAYIEDNPEKIKEYVSPIWNKVKNEKLTYEIHFFKPPAISFVNFSNFKSLGKDVSDVRKDIEWITTSFKPSTHALMCKTYAGYRVTTPIVDKDGNMLGGLSLGKKIDWLPSVITQTTKNKSFLIYRNESARSLAPKYYEKFISDKKLAGEYILANSTLDVTTQDIKNIDLSKKIQDITINGENYSLNLFPIIDFNKNIMAYVSTVTQLKEFKESFTKSIVKNFFLLFIGAFFVFITTKKMIFSLLKQIEYIKSTTHEIRERKFEHIREQSKNPIFRNDSLIQLENNVIEMGLELEKQYNHLEQKVQEKTKDLNEKTHELESLLSSYDKHVIYSSTDLDGIITDVSSAFCRVSGYSREELIGYNHNIVRHPDTPPEFFEKIWKELKEEKSFKAEIQNLKKDGGYFWVQTFFDPEYDKDGKHIGYRAVRDEITDRKESESLQNEIEETQKEVIFTMGSIGETRSKETGNHVKRVAEYSKLFALHYGLSENEAELLKQISPMHDIGKVAIPDYILNKPGKLTDPEMEIMKTHAELGFEMLKGSKRSLLSMASTVAHEHHEKWDGSGYPQGLKGEEIHIYGRITAVADVFDALGSDRVYKEAWSDEKIFSLLKEESGKHFEPRLIEIFFKHLEEFLAIRKMFHDEFLKDKK